MSPILVISQAQQHIQAQFIWSSPYPDVFDSHQAPKKLLLPPDCIKHHLKMGPAWYFHLQLSFEHEVSRCFEYFLVILSLCLTH